MRAFICVGVATLSVGAAACRSLDTEAQQFRVRWQPKGVLNLTAGDRQKQVSLSRDIVGCLGELFDSSNGERLGKGEGSNTVLDVSEEDGHRFVLMSAVAAPNCNVQGACGAGGPDVTLIWLHVGADLSILEKQVFAVEDCRAPRWVEGQSDDWFKRVALKDGVLTLNFTEMVDAGATMSEASGRVTYDTRAARSGIQVVRPPQQR